MRPRLATQVDRRLKQRVVQVSGAAAGPAWVLQLLLLLWPGWAL